MISSVYLREKPDKMIIELQKEFFHNIKKLDDFILMSYSYIFDLTKYS